MYTYAVSFIEVYTCVHTCRYAFKRIFMHICQVRAYEMLTTTRVTTKKQRRSRNRKEEDDEEEDDDEDAEYDWDTIECLMMNRIHDRSIKCEISLHEDGERMSYNPVAVNLNKAPKEGFAKKTISFPITEAARFTTEVLNVLYQPKP